MFGRKFLLIAILNILAAGGAYAVVPDSFSDLVEEVNPSVVNIVTQIEGAKGATNTPQIILPENAPEFFGDLLRRAYPQTEALPPQSALGSGFIIDQEGYIVTNNHVIDGATSISVETQDGLTLNAEVVGRDPSTDIALLKVETDVDLDYVEFGDSDAARVGDWVIAVGNPYGQGFSVSAGIISARNRDNGGRYDDLIQTDAAINRGNSGGPLFNMDGNVIGVNTMIFSPNGGSVGIGFAMSSRIVKDVVDQLRQYGETRRGWLGVRIEDVREDIAKAINLPKAEGALVAGVPEGPAQKAGILPGDVILKFNDKKVKDSRTLIRLVGSTPVDETVELEIYRTKTGKTEKVEVTLGRFETQLAENAPKDPESIKIEGMSVFSLDESRANALGVEPQGIYVEAVEPGSMAEMAGIQAGDIIRELEQTPIKSPEELKDVLDLLRKSGRNGVLVLIERNQDFGTVVLMFQ